MDKRIKIGEVGVVSGQLVICDQCYINHEGEHRDLNDYFFMIKKRAKIGDGGLNLAEKYLQLNYDLGHDGLGVVFDSGLGDGTYDVYATIGKVNDCGQRIKKVDVILIEQDE